MSARWVNLFLSTLAISWHIGWASGDEQAGFEGKVILERHEEGFVPSLRVVEDFGFRQSQGKFWKVTRGEVFDGRGLPPLLSDVAGAPYDGAFRNAAIVYESATQRMTDKWDDAQRMFFEAAVVEGIPVRDAKVMYLLLAVQGSRWEIRPSRCFGSCHGISSPLEWRPVADETRASELINWVRATNPKLADIDEQVPSAIRANGPHIFTQPPCAMFSGSTQVRKSCD